MTILVIGAGGVGGWIISALAKSVSPGDLVIIADGDKFEDKNLDRQLFSDEAIGKNKAEACCEGICHTAGTFVPLGQFVTPTTELPVLDAMFCCVDNHAARAAALHHADINPKYTHTIICANEYTDAEAYYYNRTFKGTENDPRVYYPELLTDHSGDPTRPCLAEMKSSPQLAIANMMAGSMAMWLYYFHTVHRKMLSPQLTNHFPVRISSTANKFRLIMETQHATT